MNDSRDHYLQKPLPSAPEAETAIVGAIILDNDAILQCLEKNLQPDDFYSPIPRRVYKAMQALFERGERIDPILIGQELKKDGSIDSIGGIASITNLTYGLPHFSDIQDYIKVVKEKSTARQLIHVCNQTISEVLGEEAEVAESIDRTEQNLYDLRHQNSKRGFTKAYTVVEAAHNKIASTGERRSGNALLGLSTGFTELNEYLAGLEAPNLIVIAGRPSMGKTAMCMDIVNNATTDDAEAVVAFFTLEMSKEQMGIRQITQLAKVDSKRYRRNDYLSTAEQSRIAIAAKEIQSKRVFFEDAPGLNALEIQAMSRRLASDQKRLDLIVVDQLTLMGSIHKNSDVRVEFGNRAQMLKEMAKRLNVPVIVLHQLSRKCEDRIPPRPMMSDLYESGYIEQHADVVLLLYRSEYYKKTLKKKDMIEEGVAEVLVEKNRNGPTGIVKLQYTDYCSHFENLERLCL